MSRRSWLDNINLRQNRRRFFPLLSGYRPESPGINEMRHPEGSRTLSPFGFFNRLAIGIMLVLITATAEFVYLEHSLPDAWFGVFGGQIETARIHFTLFQVPENPTVLDLAIAHQGSFLTYGNLVVSVLWLLDVVVVRLEGIRLLGRMRKALSAVHILTWLHVLVSFLIASIAFSKNNTILVMGWVMVGAVALSLLTRLIVGGNDSQRDRLESQRTASVGDLS